MNQTVKEIAISGLTRHLTQNVGGILIGTGVATQDEAGVVVGVGMGLVAYGWSAFRKWRRNRKLRAV